MEENEVKNTPKEYTKEELTDIANQLLQQNNALMARVREMDMANLFKRLDYLFKVTENNMIFPDEFVVKCVSEIVNLLTIKEEPEEGTENTDKE